MAEACDVTPHSTTEQPYRARRQNWMNQLERHTLMQPHAPALRFLGNTVTWAQLHARVTALADGLSRHGVGAGDRVLVLMLNRTEFRYKHPKGIEIVDALPRNPAGKVLKTELRAHHGARRAPEAGSAATDSMQRDGDG